MSISFIELLRQKVSAIVLEGESSALVEKSDALAQFYPFFLEILKSRPELIPALQNQLNPTLSEIFGHHTALKEQFLAQVSAALSQAETERLLSQSITPTLAVLAEEAGSTDQDAIHHLLLTHQGTILAVLPHWAMALLAGLGISPAEEETLLQAPTLEPEPAPYEEKRSSLLWWLIGIVVLAILATLLLRACHDDDNVPPPQNIAAVEQPALFQLNTGNEGELVTCQIRNGDLKYQEILQGEVRQIFSHPSGCGVETQQSYQMEFIDQNALPSVIKLLQGTPNAFINWTDHQIVLQASRQADAQRLANQIRPLVPHMSVSIQPAGELRRPAPGPTAAEQALAQINPDQIRPLDIATALNLETIHFASGSDALPDVNKPILDQAAVLLQRVPHVVVTVKGHTDTDGSAAFNNQLSIRRAQAVVNYLVSQGVAPNKLQALGYGQDQPVTENATRDGKYQNRRIEFEILNTETGVVREVDEEGVTSRS